MIEKASILERKTRTQSTSAREAREQYRKLDLLMTEAVDVITGEASRNLPQMANDRVRDFKEEARQVLDDHPEDSFEEYTAKRRNVDESEEKKKEIPSVDVVSEVKRIVRCRAH